MSLNHLLIPLLLLVVGCRVEGHTSHGGRLTGTELLHQLNMLAYRGDVGDVKGLFSHHERDILAALRGKQRTPVHFALQGRHESLAYQSTSLRGNHEEVVTFLVESAGVFADQGCPLYYALHYRNTKALKILLQMANPER